MHAGEAGIRQQTAHKGRGIAVNDLRVGGLQAGQFGCAEPRVASHDFGTQKIAARLGGRCTRQKEALPAANFKFHRVGSIRAQGEEQARVQRYRQRGKPQQMP